MKEWLNANADLVTNILDFTAFLLVTPDIVGRDRLDRFRDWLVRTHPLGLLGSQGDTPSISRLALAMVLALLILASGMYISAWWNWAGTLATPLKFIMRGLNVVWGGFSLFALLPAFFTITGGSLVLIAELLRLTIVKWEISGVMLIVGTLVFTVSRGLAIWHSLSKAG